MKSSHLLPNLPYPRMESTHSGSPAGRRNVQSISLNWCGLIWGACLSLTPVAQGTDVTLIDSDTAVPAESSFASPGASPSNWSVGSFPTSGNDYFVGSARTLRTTAANNTSQTFAGDSLNLGDGNALSGNLNFKTSGIITVNNLRMDGGRLINGGIDGSNDSGIATLSGNLTLLGTHGGTIYTGGNNSANSRNFVINSIISGTGPLTLTGRATPGGVNPGTATQSITMNGSTSSYTGGTTIEYVTAILGHSSALGATSGTFNLGGGGANGTGSVLNLNGHNLGVGRLTGLTGSVISGGSGVRTLTIGHTGTGNNGTASTFAGVIQNGGATSVSVEKTGTGVQTFTATHTYTGSTLVSGGTLVISGSGSINGSSGVTVNGGTLNYSSSTNLTAPLTFTSGALAGTNFAGKTLSIGTNQAISPGNSTGTLVSAAQTWADGGTYVWEMNDAMGTAGGNGWDLLSIDGALTITADSGSPFNIHVVSLNSQVAGEAANFDALVNGAWLIADATSAITTFDANAFDLDLSLFQNAYSGTWKVALGGSGSFGGDNSQIYLTYTAIPEPSTTLLLTGGLMALILFRRR